jgi:hypothetical protein
MTKGSGPAPDKRAFGYWRSTRPFAVFFVALIIIAFCLRVLPRRLRAAAGQSRRKSIAYSVLNKTSTAMDVVASWIELRTRFTPFRHTVFGGLNCGADVTVSWIDTKPADKMREVHRKAAVAAGGREAVIPRADCSRIIGTNGCSGNACRLFWADHGRL